MQRILASEAEFEEHINETNEINESNETVTMEKPASPSLCQENIFQVSVRI